METYNRNHEVIKFKNYEVTRDKRTGEILNAYDTKANEVIYNQDELKQNIGRFLPKKNNYSRHRFDI